MKQITERINRILSELANDLQVVCLQESRKEDAARELELIVAVHTGALRAIAAKHREQQERIADNNRIGAEKVYS